MLKKLTLCLFILITYTAIAVADTLKIVRITVQSNERTQNVFILQRMPFAIGSVYSNEQALQDALAIGLQRLYDIDLFSSVGIRYRPITNTSSAVADVVIIGKRESSNRTNASGYGLEVPVQ